MSTETRSTSAAPLAMKVIDGEAGVRGLSELLDSSFPVPAGGHYFNDFPIWAAGASLDRIRIGVYRQDLLLNAACARVARMKIGDRTVPMGLIGAVVTRPEFRGAGLAGRTIATALEWLQTRGAVFAVLWGTASNLYSRLGFEPFGEQADSLLVDLALRPARSETVQEGWHPEIFPLLRERIGGLDLSAEDRSWVEQHRNVRWFWTGPAARPTAYAALGKGIDLAGFVHEWGGEREALHALLSGVRDRVPTARILGSPRTLAHYGLVPIPAATAPVCLARVIDVEAVRGIEGADFWLWGLDGA